MSNKRYINALILLLPCAASAAELEFGGKVINPDTGLNFADIGLVALGAFLALVALVVFVIYRIKSGSGDNHIDSSCINMSRQRESDLSMQIAANYNQRYYATKRAHINISDNSDISSGKPPSVIDEPTTEKVYADALFGSSDIAEPLPLAS